MTTIQGLLTTLQAAERTGASIGTIKNHARAGKLHPIRLAGGRDNLYRVEEVDAWNATRKYKRIATRVS